MGVGGNVIGRMGAARESAYFKLEQVLCLLQRCVLTEAHDVVAVGSVELQSAQRWTDGTAA